MGKSYLVFLVTTGYLLTCKSILNRLLFCVCLFNQAIKSFMVITHLYCRLHHTHFYKVTLYQDPPNYNAQRSLVSISLIVKKTYLGLSSLSEAYYTIQHLSKHTNILIIFKAKQGVISSKLGQTAETEAVAASSCGGDIDVPPPHPQAVTPPPGCKGTRVPPSGSQTLQNNLLL